MRGQVSKIILSTISVLALSGCKAGKFDTSKFFKSTKIVLGVSGGADSNIDDKLEGSTSPTIHYDLSSLPKTTSTEFFITDANGPVSGCQGKPSASQIQLALAGCNLTIGQSYNVVAKVMANDSSELKSLSETFSFEVISSVVIGLSSAPTTAIASSTPNVTLNFEALTDGVFDNSINSTATIELRKDSCDGGILNTTEWGSSSINISAGQADTIIYVKKVGKFFVNVNFSYNGRNIPYCDSDKSFEITPDTTNIKVTNMTVTPDPQVDTDFTLSAKILDQFDNPISGKTVSLEQLYNASTLTPDCINNAHAISQVSGSTSADGTATFTTSTKKSGRFVSAEFKLGTVQACGDSTFRIKSGAPHALSFEEVPATPNQAPTTNSTSVGNGNLLANSFKVNVKDVEGNNVDQDAGHSVTLTAKDGNCVALGNLGGSHLSLGGSSSSHSATLSWTDDGIAENSTNLFLTKAGTYKFEASSNGKTECSSQITVNAAPATIATLTPPSPEGGEIDFLHYWKCYQMQVSAFDAWGNSANISGAYFDHLPNINYSGTPPSFFTSTNGSCSGTNIDSDNRVAISGSRAVDFRIINATETLSEFDIRAYNHADSLLGSTSSVGVKRYAFGTARDGDKTIAVSSQSVNAAISPDSKIFSASRIVNYVENSSGEITFRTTSNFNSPEDFEPGDEILWVVLAVGEFGKYTAQGTNSEHCGTLEVGEFGTEIIQATPQSDEIKIFPTTAIKDFPTGDLHPERSGSSGSEPFCVIQIQRVPNLNSLTISAMATLKPTPFSLGSTLTPGGIISFRARHLTYDVQTKITLDASGSGFAMGQGFSGVDSRGDIGSRNNAGYAATTATRAGGGGGYLAGGNYEARGDGLGYGIYEIFSILFGSYPQTSATALTQAFPERLYFGGGGGTGNCTPLAGGGGIVYAFLGSMDMLNGEFAASANGTTIICNTGQIPGGGGGGTVRIHVNQIKNYHPSSLRLTSNGGSVFELSSGGSGGTVQVGCPTGLSCSTLFQLVTTGGSGDLTQFSDGQDGMRNSPSVSF